jgi:16S rRNA (uracil1498-N3)-methyltransferase
VSRPRLRLEHCRDLGDGVYEVDPDQARHLLKVRRLYPGALVEGLLPGVRRELRLSLEGERVLVLPVRDLAADRLDVRVVLCPALLKAEAFDLMLRTSAELGAGEIQPLLAARSVPRFEPDRQEEKLARWRRILDEATRQAGATRCPRIYPPLPVDHLRNLPLPEDRYAALLDPEAVPLFDVSPSVAVALAVGPEGDWTPEEAEELKAARFRPVGLGPRILRSPTASMVLVARFTLATERER